MEIESGLVITRGWEREELGVTAYGPELVRFLFGRMKHSEIRGW